MSTAQAGSPLTLRQRAEEKYKIDRGESVKTLSPEEAEQLLQELQVHQIELEIQNEDLRRTQHDLETVKNRYFDLYDLAPVAYLTLNEPGLIQEANLTAANLFCVTLKELLKKPLTNFILPEDQNRYYLYRKQVVEVSGVRGCELHMLRADGSLFWAHLQATDGQAGECLVTITDITERKQSEEALAKTYAQTVAILHCAAEGIMDLDTEGNHTFVNAAAERMLGYPIKELVGKNSHNTWHYKHIDGSPYPESDCPLHAALHDGKPTSGEDYFIKNDGTCFLAAFSSMPTIIDSKVTGMVFSFSDITERKRLEKERQKLEQQFQHTQKLESLGILAGGIAHDFNNILTVIICNCSLLQKRPHLVEELVLEIETAAHRAADLCRQMLIYAGKAQPIPTKFNLKTLVEEMVKMLKATINQNVIIALDLSADIPLIKADASQIRQVVMNLIINASDAIGTEQGNISVSLAIAEIAAEQSEKDYLGKVITPDSYICLNVTDNGCGMDEETKQRIFEPFYTTKSTGRGLGMSALLGIINAHNGALQLTSQQGFGTTFKVYLPVQGSEPVGDLLPHVSVMPWQGSGTVLLVEDEPPLVMVAKALIQALGFSVIEAANGQIALELFQKNAKYITLVLTDIGMPVMDGYELIQELKILNPELPIIVSSGFGDDEVTSRIHENIAGVVSKPYSFDQLREALKSVVEGAEAK